MKIAFVGNENNIPFAFARYLRDRGWDADVLMFNSESAHFHPSHDCYDASYQSFCYTLPFGGGFDLAEHSPDSLAQHFSPYDVLIGTNYAPAYIHRSGRVMDVFIPHGGDIASAVAYGKRCILRPFKNAMRVHHQRAGIGACRVIHSDFHQPLYERNLQRFGRQAERWRSAFPTIYAPQYAQLETPEALNEPQRKLQALREKSQLVAIAPCRHFWASKRNPGAKGNDTMLQSWKRFHDERPNLTKTLLLLEYGPHVAKSKALIEQLGLNDTVHWLPVMPRKELMYYYFLADIVLGEFVHSWTTGGVLFESLVSNRPIITYRDESALSRADLAALYEIYPAQNAPEISAQLTRFCDERARGTAIGSKGRDWYLKHVVADSLERYEALFKHAD